ncbi:MAG: hypothetical protein ACLFVU_11105 [Phycisphaerae bacterium]
MNRGRYDEAKLTAYALGELDAEGRTEVEQWMREDPVLREQVQQIRAVSEHIGAELTEVSDERLHPEQRKHIESRIYGSMQHHRRRRIVWAPVWLAAASVILVLTVLVVVLPQMEKDRSGSGLEGLDPKIPTTRPTTNPADGSGRKPEAVQKTENGSPLSGQGEPETRN